MSLEPSNPNKLATNDEEGETTIKRTREVNMKAIPQDKQNTTILPIVFIS